MTAPRYAHRHRAATSDVATRERLIDAATEQFAEFGFRRTSVRDICRAAGANVAAVNYHFDGKLGLYKEVVSRAIQAMRETTRALIVPDPALPADERLRHYVRAYVPLIAAREAQVQGGRAGWIHKLMRHESAEPTPLAPWIADEVVKPRVRHLSRILAELLGTTDDDPRVARCVISIEAQCLSYAPNKFRECALQGWPTTTTQIAQAAEHIADFSLAGIRQIATEHQPGA